MLLSHDKKFIFIHIYKNAGTSVTNALLPFTTNKWQRGVDGLLGRFDIRLFDPQPYPDHIMAGDLIERMGRRTFKKYFSFAIVRNPWDWLVSIYEFTRNSTEHPQHEFYNSFKSFDEYIKWRVVQLGGFQKDFIYSPVGELLVDYVAKYENLETDFKIICSKIGISASLPWLNSSGAKPYREYYNEETRELVRKALDKDISLFGYDF